MSLLTIAELKSFLPANTVTNLTVSESHIKRAWLKHFPKYIGRDLMNRIEATEPPEDLHDMVKPALANFALFEAIPFLDIVLTSTGFGIVSNDNIAPASADRVKALAARAMEAANDGMDALLQFIETSEEGWADDWNKSCIIPGGIIRNVDDFQQYFDINESRVRFYFYKRNLELYQRKRFVTAIGSRQLDNLLLSRVDRLVLPLLEQAIVNFALAKEDITYHDTGEEFLRLAIAEMIDRPTVYTLFHSDAYEAPHVNNEDQYPVFG
jgi:hypothetical protein